MKIVFLGAGNLATNLAMAMKNAGHEIVQVYSRTSESAEELARKTVSEGITSLNRMVHDADLYVLSVKDDAIPQVADNFPVGEGFLVHTAGSVPMELLKDRSSNYGVLYPLQTFSKDKLTGFSNIPLCLEANTSRNLDVLKELASSLSRNIYELNSSQRAGLHVAAVFSCNFTNYMLAKAEEVLHKQDISFDILFPLIRETIDKALDYSPSQVQTGPAVRGDRQTIDRHLKLLAYSDKLQNLYRFVSNAMVNDHNSGQESKQ